MENAYPSGYCDCPEAGLGKYLNVPQTQQVNNEGFYTDDEVQIRLDSKLSMKVPSISLPCQSIISQLMEPSEPQLGTCIKSSSCVWSTEENIIYKL